MINVASSHLYLLLLGLPIEDGEHLALVIVVRWTTDSNFSGY